MMQIEFDTSNADKPTKHRIMSPLHRCVLLPSLKITETVRKCARIIKKRYKHQGFKAS